MDIVWMDGSMSMGDTFVTCMGPYAVDIKGCNCYIERG